MKTGFLAVDGTLVEQHDMADTATGAWTVQGVAASESLRIDDFSGRMLLAGSLDRGLFYANGGGWLMAVKGRQVTITTSATPIASGADSATGRIVVVLRNASGAVRLGGPDVAASGPQMGVQFTTGDAELGPLHLASADSMFGITATGTQTIEVLVVG